ncbi:MAG: 4-hydroxythreonine-4-phosphate dehydrogenase PdxA [Pseudomonadota bacterium]
MGDPAGIGPEITVRAWHHFKTATSNASTTPGTAFVAFSDPAVLEQCASALKRPVPIKVISALDEARATFQHALPVFPLSLLKPVKPGQPEAMNAPAVIHAIETAVAATLKGHIDAVVTNPIAKSVLYDIGFAHPGHTEFLASLAAHARPEMPAHPVMMLASDELRVVPLTIHIPLKEVPAAITVDAICATARVLNRALQIDFGMQSPRIAVAGLNPHAGESGTIGTEDEETVRPAIEKLIAEGLDISGPLSADTMFHKAARQTFDAALCMYHDQALIPIKTLAFDQGVNVTLGLPFIRTSPDHGTAFDIAGTGRASADSLIAALNMADDIVRRKRAAKAAA